MFAAIAWSLLLSAAPAPEVDPPLDKEGIRKLETNVIGLLRDGQLDKLATVQAQLGRQPAGQQALIPVRVSKDRVEFRFNGQFHADAFNAEGLEYLISDPTKNYESLTVVDKSELLRYGAVDEAIQALRAANKKITLHYELAWSEEKRLRRVDVRSILGLIGQEERERFLGHLRFNPHGLGSFNVKGDQALLPKARVDVEFFVSIQWQ